MSMDRHYVNRGEQPRFARQIIKGKWPRTRCGQCIKDLSTRGHTITWRPCRLCHNDEASRYWPCGSCRRTGRHSDMRPSAAPRETMDCLVCNGHGALTSTACDNFACWNRGYWREQAEYARDAARFQRGELARPPRRPQMACLPFGRPDEVPGQCGTCHGTGRSWRCSGCDGLGEVPHLTRCPGDPAHPHGLGMRRHSMEWEAELERHESLWVDDRPYDRAVPAAQPEPSAGPEHS